MCEEGQRELAPLVLLVGVRLARRVREGETLGLDEGPLGTSIGHQQPQ